LIDKLEEDDIPGLLLLIDFEKAFDTVEWSFIEKTLQFYGFGPSLQKWIKAFYCDISVMGRQFLRKCFGFPSFGMHVINP
jgi:hypothetical protein